MEGQAHLSYYEIKMNSFHFVNNMMSQGAGLIDADGIVIIECDETPA